MPSSRPLLFEPLDAYFKLQPLINLAVLEVAELFVDVVDFRLSEPWLSTLDRSRFSSLQIITQVGDFLMHACEMRSQSEIDNVLDLIQVAFIHTQRVYHAGAGEKAQSARRSAWRLLEQVDGAAVAVTQCVCERIGGAQLVGHHYLDGGLIGYMLLSVVELASEFPAPRA